MGRAFLTLLVVCIAAMAASTTALAQGTLNASLAFVRNDALTIVARHGEVLDTIFMRPPVTDFTISPDRRLVVVVTNGSSQGGDLELIDLRVRKRTQLIPGPIYFKNPQKDEREVYADPKFSPDGKFVAFAVRTTSNADPNDTSDAKSHLAVVDVATAKVRMVQSTTTGEGHAHCYANTPLWSPDGSQLLFSCESGFAIASLDTSKLKRLPGGSAQRPWTAAVGWIGRRCIIYVEAADDASSDREVRLMSLSTAETRDARSLVSRQRAQPAGLAEISGEAAISRTSNVTINTPSNNWVLPKDAPAHLLTGWARDEIPAACR